MNIIETYLCQVHFRSVYLATDYGQSDQEAEESGTGPN
jgi:hypothetical protein